MKRMIAMLLTLALTLAMVVFPAQANANDLTYEVKNGAVTINGYARADLGHLTIPDTIDGYPVTAIGRRAFRNCSGIVSVSIPDTVTDIGEQAFYGCENLESVDFGNSVATIGNHAFYLCSALKTVEIPDSVTSIGIIAFYGCENMTSLTIGNGVTSIGMRAFASCKKLESVIIGDSLASISEFMLNSCSALTSVTIPSSVTTIEKGAFNNCGSLRDVYYAGNEAQWNQIAVGADNTALTDATRHTKDTTQLCGISIKSQPIKTRYLSGEELDTTGLTLTASYADGTTMEITEGFTVAGFSSDVPGTQILTVTYGGYAATFAVVVIAREEVNTCGDNLTWTLSEEGVLTISGFGPMYNYYESETPWFITAVPIKKIVVETGATTIGQWAFCDMWDVSEVQLPDTITTIGGSAFSRNGVTSITIPAGVTKIADTAFSMANKLTGIWVDEDNAYYCSDEYGVLYNKDKTVLMRAPAKGLEGEYTIPEGVTDVGFYGFYKCDALTSVKIPISVKLIDEGAFGACAALRHVYYDGARTQWRRISILPINDSLYGAKLHVVEPAEIITQPTDAEVTSGAIAQFSVEATNVVTYRWMYRKSQRDGWMNTTMEGYDTDTLSVPALLSRNGYQYRCRIVDADGMRYDTDIATLTVRSSVFIELQPADQTVTAGEKVVFVAGATGDGLTYQWQYRKSEDGNWMNTTMSGFNTDTLSVPALLSRNGYQYRCRIADANGVCYDTDAATLLVRDSVSIEPQPVDQTAAVGENAVFITGATGEGLSYQWLYRKNSDDFWKVTTMFGAKTDTLLVSVIKGRNGYQYCCKITDAQGNVRYTDAATLTVE